ncbi:MAG: helix-turn-helix domain-containing protein [Bacteroidetes bacterium]|nr:helix-turn-helix domain-containing protein [Bacteroidota bacterium]
MAEVACREGGLTDVKLAKLFGVAKSTINLWKKEHPDFSDSIKKGKDDWDSEKIENSLAKRALGFSYTETTKEPRLIKKPDGDITTSDMVVTKKVTKLIVPDTTAQIFWLKNRQPKRWRDRHEVEVTGDDELIKALFAGRQRVNGQQD